MAQISAPVSVFDFFFDLSFLALAFLLGAVAVGAVVAGDVVKGELVDGGAVDSGVVTVGAVVMGTLVAVVVLESALAAPVRPAIRATATKPPTASLPILRISALPGDLEL